jgi:hypothetical protein
MNRKLAAVWICFMLLALFYHAFAMNAEAPQLTAVSEQPLRFSQPPLRIEKAERLPNGHVVVFYFSQGEDKREERYRMDLFAASGECLLSREMGAYIPDVSTYPFAQILIKGEHFLCEYYPDITTMEVCYGSVYTFDGRAVQADKKSTFRYGDVDYAWNHGQFILKRQAHAYDEEVADPFIRLKLEHVPTGKTLQTAVWDPVFRAFSDGANRLWIVQKNERENLEIWAYTASDAVTEQIVEIDEPTLKTHDVASICAAVLHQENACLLVRLSNMDHVLLTYDAESQQITTGRALTTLSGADYIAGLMTVGPRLLAVNGVWDETTQTFSWALGVVEQPAEQVPLPFKGKAFSVFANGKDGTIVALEKDAGAWLLREYRLEKSTPA